MIDEVIFQAQDYLTTQDRGQQLKRIIDLDVLLNKHTMKEVLEFLTSYLVEKQKGLKNMIAIDKTNRRVDEMIAAIFRLHMAIDTLKMGKEVKHIGAIKQGAGKSGKFQRRYRRGHNRTRSWENHNHDGKNRYPGQKIQRAA